MAGAGAGRRGLGPHHVGARALCRSSDISSEQREVSRGLFWHKSEKPVLGCVTSGRFLNLSVPWLIHLRGEADGPCLSGTHRVKQGACGRLLVTPHKHYFVPFAAII